MPRSHIQLERDRDSRPRARASARSRRPVDTGLDDHKQRRNEIRNDLCASNASLLHLARQLDEKLAAEGGLLRRHAELKQDFERLNTPELAERFVRLDLARRQLAVLADAAEKLRQLTLRLEELLVPTQKQLWERESAAPDEDLESWWQDEVIPALQLSELTGDLESVKASVRASLARREQTVARLREEANGRVATEEAAIREGIGAETEQSIQVDQRERSKARFERADRLRNEYSRCTARSRTFWNSGPSRSSGSRPRSWLSPVRGATIGPL